MSELERVRDDGISHKDRPRLAGGWRLPPLSFRSLFFLKRRAARADELEEAAVAQISRLFVLKRGRVQGVWIAGVEAQHANWRQRPE